MENKRLTYKLNEQEQEEHKTKYLKFEYFPIPDYCIEKGNYERISSDMIYNKLGKIEDLLEKHNIPNIEYLERCIIAHDKYGELEEQIGCPLDVVIKAMSSEIYYDIASGTGTIVQPYLVVNDDGMFVFDTMGEESSDIFLNDYKQTWWLKEDRSI